MPIKIYNFYIFPKKINKSVNILRIYPDKNLVNYNNLIYAI